MLSLIYSEVKRRGGIYKIICMIPSTRVQRNNSGIIVGGRGVVECGPAAGGNQGA